MSSRYFAVFGDTHGHLRLMFQLCRLWQRAHKRHLDGVLQCGDLGYFPDIGKLDKATLRFAHEDSEELGFSRFFSLPEPEESDELLERIIDGPRDSLDTVICRVIWTNGNHEDFEALSQQVGAASVAAVDAFGVLELLRSGAILTMSGLTVAAIGGAPETDRPSRHANPRFEDWRLVSQHACDRLVGQDFNVLITHGAPFGLGGESDVVGSYRLEFVDQRNDPSYHFFAHHRRPIPQGKIGQTRCYWLNDVNFERRSRGRFGQLAPGCMGLLRWSDDTDHEFTVLDEPWMRSLTFENWRFH